MLFYVSNQFQPTTVVIFLFRKSIRPIVVIIFHSLLSTNLTNEKFLCSFFVCINQINLEVISNQLYTSQTEAWFDRVSKKCLMGLNYCRLEAAYLSKLSHYGFFSHSWDFSLHLGKHLTYVWSLSSILSTAVATHEYYYPFNLSLPNFCFLKEF